MDDLELKARLLDLGAAVRRGVGTADATTLQSVVLVLASTLLLDDPAYKKPDVLEELDLVLLKFQNAMLRPEIARRKSDAAAKMRRQEQGPKLTLVAGSKS